MNDLKFAFRQLLKNPGFTTVVVLTLALGIGANTAVFSVVKGVLLQPPPYLQPERLTLISLAKTDGSSFVQGCSGAQLAEWRAEAKSFEALAGYIWTFNFLLDRDGSESMEGMAVSADYFRVTGLQPILGRSFNTADVGQHPVVLLGYEFWRRRFHSDANIIGKTIHLSRWQAPLTVVGVMPSGIRFLPAPINSQEPKYDVNAFVDFWIAASPNANDHSQRMWNVVGRLKPRMNLSQAQAEMATIATRQAQSEPEMEGITTKIERLGDLLNSEARRILAPLFGAVCFVVLIACSNISGLLLARGLDRRREFAMRMALGAGQARVIRQILCESLLTSLIGGALGVFLAYGALETLVSFAPRAIPRLDAARLDAGVLAFTLSASLLTGIMSGLLPALGVAQPRLGQLMGGGLRTSRALGESRLLHGLAAAQVALTLVLLIGAGLMIQSVARLAKVKPGYDTKNILTLNVTSFETDWHHFHNEALAKVSALPGVRAAAFAWGVPLSGNKSIDNLEIDGRNSTRQLKDTISVSSRAVTSDFFRLMGITLSEGRSFRPTDTTNSPAVAIINETMANRYFPQENPIGKRLIFSAEPTNPCEIIGIVRDIRSDSLSGPVEPEVYLSINQSTAFSKHLLVRTVADPRGLISIIRSELRSIDPSVAIEEVKTMQEIRSESVAGKSFFTTLISAFSFIACMLTMVGIYGLMSYSVTRRTREIGIRMAVGAQRSHIASTVLGRGTKTIAAGAGIGIVGAYWLTHFLASLLFGVKPTDPAAYAVGALLSFASGMLASWLPARRAARVDPMHALRYE